MSYNLPTTSLGLLGLGGLLVLSHLEQLVGQALGVGAVRLAQLGNVHHVDGWMLQSSVISKKLKSIKG